MLGKDEEGLIPTLEELCPGPSRDLKKAQIAQ